jgi:hypothetical protein
MLLSGTAAAQAPEQSPSGAAPTFWQPPQTDGDDRPNEAPVGYCFYGQAEYLMFWTQRDHFADAPGPAPGEFGALVHSGARATLGIWLNQGQTAGVELGGLWASQVGSRQAGTSAATDAWAALTQRFWDAEISYRGEIYRGTWAHFDLLGGFKFFSFDESLDFAAQPLPAGPGASENAAGRNRFYGAQIGAETEVHWDRWFLDAWAKAGLGGNVETSSAQASLPAQASRLERDELAFLPEIGVNFGWQMTSHARLTAGYTWMYLTGAARPGEGADALLHWPNSGLSFSTGPLWIQGWSIGAEFRF